MEEAAKTTALGLAKMPGFQRYTAAAVTGDSQLVLFMHMFDTAEQAEAAQLLQTELGQMPILVKWRGLLLP